MGVMARDEEDDENVKEGERRPACEEVVMNGGTAPFCNSELVTDRSNGMETEGL